MQTLIDGYNLMHELGLLDKQTRPEAFRKARSRFLDKLAKGLGAVAAYQTTVVFDATQGPRHLPGEATHKGLTIIFADEDEGADARIERLIATHSAPRSLTVVSTDRRIRQAAARRKARTLTADAFWEHVENATRPAPAAPSRTPEDESRLHGLTPEQAADWLETFRDLASRRETQEALGQDGTLLTDDDIRRIAREVNDEERKRR
jgi:predicted RNA-binding protein with PIN domain